MLHAFDTLLAPLLTYCLVTRTLLGQSSNCVAGSVSFISVCDIHLTLYSWAPGDSHQTLVRIRLHDTVRKHVCTGYLSIRLSCNIQRKRAALPSNSTHSILDALTLTVSDHIIASRLRGETALALSQLHWLASRSKIHGMKCIR